MKFLSLLILLSSCTFAQAGSIPDTVDMTLITPLHTVLSAPQQYENKTITVSGTVEAVCEKRGCWAEIVDQNKNKLRIKVRDGKVVIPMSTVGKTAIVTGTLTPLNLSKEQAILYLEHMAHDAGEAFERSSVTSGMTIYNMRPDALKFVAN